MLDKLKSDKPRKKTYFNPKANQRINRTTGKFMKKVGTKPLTPALPASADLMTCLASLAPPMTIAKRIEKLARSGDGAALSLQIQALNQHKPIVDEQYDTTKLSAPRLRVLLDLLQQARGETVPDIEILHHGREMTAELDYLDPVIPDDPDPEEDEQDVQPVTLPAPPPSPLPVPRAKPPRMIGAYTEEQLDAAQPSTGQRSYRSPMHIHDNQGDYDTEGKRYDIKDLARAIAEPAPPPKRKAN